MRARPPYYSALVGAVGVLILMIGARYKSTVPSAEGADDVRFPSVTEAARIPFEEDGGHIFLQLRIKDSDPVETRLSERSIIGLGYEFLENGTEQQAVNLFKLLTAINPTSADAFDSLAEAYSAGGDVDGMKAASRMVLELLPTDRTLDDDARESLRKNAEERLKTQAPK